MCDVRIAMTYQGTKQIQAIDLLLREVLADGGERLDRFLQKMELTTQAKRHGSVLFGSKEDTACYYFTCLLPEVQQLLGVTDACSHTCDNAARSALSIDQTICDAAEEAT